MHADGEMVEIISIINYPGGIFALGGEGFVVGQERDRPETGMKEMIDCVAIGQVERVGRIFSEGPGITRSR
jgi:hypothetical protein